MKVVLLAGGFGTRISEESHLKPKPMVEIGEKPILWHIMKQYSHYGYNDFVICAGYKQHVIKEWFANYFLHNSDITFDFRNDGKMTVHNNVAEPWTVTIVDTGLNTMTGGRIKRIQPFIGDEDFMLTYGDGVSDIDINALVEYHNQSNRIGTLSATQIDSRFGVLDIVEGHVNSFREKNKQDGGWINCGFMVFSPAVFDYIEGDATVFEKEPLEKLVADNQLNAYKHTGFWQCMDTLRDKENLEKMWNADSAPWKCWED